MVDEICIVCLDESIDPINNYLIEYNHCGNYFIHKKCLEAWEDKHNECVICRRNISEIQDNKIREHLEDLQNRDRVESSRYITNNVIQIYPRAIGYDNCQIVMFSVGIVIIFVGIIAITSEIMNNNELN